MSKKKKAFAEIIKSYSTRKVDVNNILNKVKELAYRAGNTVVYVALLLYYTFMKEDTPRWAKTVIIGAIAYLLSPLDLLPDLSPFIGYTDDIGILIYGLMTIAIFIDEKIIEQAKETLVDWFGDVPEESLEVIDKKIRDKIEEVRNT